MKNLTLPLVILLFLSNIIMAQSNLAKLKYEDAEEAFQKNDYQATLTKLDEVEALLKSSNPKTQYLRILAQDKIVSQAEVLNFEVLDKLRQNCSAYLAKNGTNTSVEDQYKEVYKISERLNSYPSSQAEYDAIIAEKKATMNKMAGRLKVIFDSLCETYRFKPGMTEDEFKAYNPEAASLLMKKGQKINAAGGSTYVRTGNGPLTLTVKNNVTADFIFSIPVGNGQTPARNFEWYKNFFEKNSSAEIRRETKSGNMEFIQYTIVNTKNMIMLYDFTATNSIWLQLSVLP